VQSALEKVKGVKQAVISREDEEAVVKYDPDVAKVDNLIKSGKGSEWAARPLRRQD
jgi:copper chaperone CopZ